MKVKKIKLTLVGIDGNAFTILIAFRKQAKKKIGQMKKFGLS